MHKLSIISVALCAMTATAANADSFKPAAPANLSAKASASIVDLSWDWGNAGERTSFTDFETEQFPPQGWQLFKTNEEEGSSWMQYFFGEDEELTLSHSGLGIMLIPVGVVEEASEAYHQDESMCIRPGKGAVYMDFWYYIHPELLEYGAYSDFPDHYYVEISRNNGVTWNELWDARWDMGNVDAVQEASLFLGQPADENTIIRFRALSGDETGLYFLWAVDDVEFLAANGDAVGAPALKASRRNVRRTPATFASEETHRKFTPGDSARAVRNSSRAPQDWANNGNTTWRVRLDGAELFSYIKAKNYTDYSAKDAGVHTYEVMAWSEKDNLEYAASSIEVEVDEFDFLPAKNVHASFEPVEGNSRMYNVYCTWEDPENETLPVSYTVLMNGKQIGMMDQGDDYNIGQALYHGVYDFEVIAVYDKPQGESIGVHAIVTPGTVPTVENMKVVESGADRIISWSKPSIGDSAPDYYTVWRGATCIADHCTALTFTDENVAPGQYLYSVHAVYSQEVSLPREVSVTVGEPVAFNLPITENFSKGHLPEGWDVTLVDLYGRVKEMYKWRFDNWFGIEWPWNSKRTASTMPASFASISGIAAGMNRLESYVVSPWFVAGENTNVTFTRYYMETKPGPSGAAKFIIQVSDDGANWTDISDLSDAVGITETNLADFTFQLKEFAGKKIQLRWGSLTRNSGEMALSNVVISNTDPSGITGIEAVITSADIYSLEGKLLRRGVRSAEDAGLAPGIYLERKADKTQKIVVK